jgi:hypothetical protein
MAATGWVARRWFGRRAVAMIPFTLLVVIGTTGTLVALGAADRTANAYGEYVERADVGDLVLNPTVHTTEVEEIIASLPGVVRVTSSSYFNTTIDDGTPRTQGEVEADTDPVIFVHGSVDGRFIEMDRPALRAGRLPTGPREALVSTEVADAEDLELGDVVPVAFWWACDLTGLCEYDEVVAPIGVEHLQVVGIGTLADEVLPDGLYPRGRMIVSPDVADRYDCVGREPRGTSAREAAELVFPTNCARSYQYFSLDLADGVNGIPAALTAFDAATRATNVRWADEYGPEGPEYFLVPTANPQERARVQRAIRPTVAALTVLAAATAALTVAVAGLAVARELRQGRADQRQWWRLGMPVSERAGIVAAPMLAAVALALAVSVGAAWLLSTIGPVGQVSTVDPSSRRELTAPVILAVLALLVVLGAGVVGLAVRSARRVARPVTDARSPRRLPSWVETTTTPALADGVRAASTVRSILLAASSAVAVAVATAAVVFGVSLSGLVATPHFYGWSWDVAVMTGFGYGDLDLEAAVAALNGNPDVEDYAVLGFVNELSLGDEPVLSVLGLDRRSDLDLTVLDGRLPAAADEVALGPKTAAERGLSVGDEITVEGEQASVSGIVVFPAVGPWGSDRVGTGAGTLFSESAATPSEVAQSATFVGVDLTDGGDADALLGQMRGWDTTGAEAIGYAEPVRPPEILDARSMRTVPVLIVAVVGAVLGAGLAFALWTSVRARRREFGILRALGFSGPQVRRSVRIQAVTTMLAALVVGVPAGVLAGRTAWQAFARQLGVVPDPADAWLWIAIVSGAAVVIALLAAVIPARIATRTTPAVGLRAE